MTIELNHTIVHVHDRDAAARDVADTLGLPAPMIYGPFAVVELTNGVSLDFMADPADITPQHYAFLVDDEVFDHVHRGLQDAGRTYWADPFRQQPGEINTNDGGRGLYWSGPDDHNLEVITRPYGS